MAKKNNMIGKKVRIDYYSGRKGSDTYKEWSEKYTVMDRIKDNGSTKYLGRRDPDGQSKVISPASIAAILGVIAVIIFFFS